MIAKTLLNELTSMNFVFLSQTDKELGTYRIWFENLPAALDRLGYCALTNPERMPNDVSCFIVSPEQDICALRERFPKAIIGTLKPQFFFRKDYKAKLSAINFFIAGSRFERDQILGLGCDVVVLRHVDSGIDIPALNLRVTKKEKNEVLLGYHGNRQHLEQLGGYIGEALESINRHHAIRLVAVYNIKKTGQWEKGRPRIPIEDVQWHLDSYAHHLLDCDIGIVPNISSHTNPRLIRKIIDSKIFGVWRGSHQEDIVFRQKLTSNAGRAFVFAQLKLPVVACPIFEILETLVPAQAAFVASSKAAWESELTALIRDPSLRERMGLNGYKWTSQNLSADREAGILIEFLQSKFGLGPVES